MKISVYITSFNQKAFLKEAIDSVLNQTFPAYEILIVDDFSTDGSREMIVEYSEKHSEIHYIFHEKNRGVSSVRRTALENFKGDYVTYVDGDDLYLPNKLEIEAQLIQEGDYNVAFSNNMYVLPNQVNKVKWIWASKELNLDPKQNLFVKTLTRDFPRNSLFRMELIHKSLIEKVGLHDENLAIYEDYDFRIRLAKYGKFNYSLHPTTKIRISENGLSRSPKLEHFKAFEYIFRKYKKEIATLEENTRAEVEKKLKVLLDKMNPNTTNSSEKKLKNIVTRIKRIGRS